MLCSSPLCECDLSSPLYLPAAGVGHTLLTEHHELTSLALCKLPACSRVA